MTSGNCTLSASCKNAAGFKVDIKPIGKRPGKTELACEQCAMKIGSMTPEGPVYLRSGHENQAYKVIRLA